MNDSTLTWCSGQHAVDAVVELNTLAVDEFPAAFKVVKHGDCHVLWVSDDMYNPPTVFNMSTWKPSECNMCIERSWWFH